MGKYVGGRPPKGQAGANTPVRDDGLVSDRFPALWDYLSATVYTDGSPRRPSTLLLFTEDSVWKVCLSDRACDRTAWAAGDTPIEALDALEHALADGGVVWRRKPQAGPGGGKK